MTQSDLWEWNRWEEIKKHAENTDFTNTEE